MFYNNLYSMMKPCQDEKGNGGWAKRKKKELPCQSKANNRNTYIVVRTCEI